MSDILDKLWVEKYRPKNISDVVLEPDQKEFLIKCLQNGEVPHLLFIGPPGSGKTTTARIICDEIIKDHMDIMELNGSDDTGVQVVRDEIKGFLQVPPFQSPHKIVYIDEFDYMTQNAQASLRNMMEKYASIGRFICTGNYLNKIMDPIQSRFQIFEMKTISEEFALDFCEKILKAEGVEYEQDNVRMVVQNLVPDVRKVIQTLQKSVVNGKLSAIDKASITSIEKKIVGLICVICDNIGTDNQKRSIDTNINEIHKKLGEGAPDFLNMYQSLFNNPKIPPWGKIAVNKYSNMHNNAAIPQIHFVAMVWEMIQNGMNFYKTFGS
jgi:replication factor C small subunit